jgi:hypothetical protein
MKRPKTAPRNQKTGTANLDSMTEKRLETKVQL